MKRTVLLTAILLYGISMAAQNYYLGLIEDQEAYRSIPQKAPLLTREYTTLPVRHSLQQYCPTPQNQGAYGTCTSWASAYAARTIAEAVNNQWTDKRVIDSETFFTTFCL